MVQIPLLDISKTDLGPKLALNVMISYNRARIFVSGFVLLIDYNYFCISDKSAMLNFFSDFPF